MNQLSNRLNALSESETLAMSQKSAELKAQGIDVINLSVGEPDFFHLRAGGYGEAGVLRAGGGQAHCRCAAADPGGQGCVL